MDRSALIEVARGDRPADLLLRGGRLVNVLSSEVYDADVAIAGGRIAGVGEGWDAEEVVDLDGAFVAPAFIDGHIHVESSFLAPYEFARVVSARGTGAVVSDPHEIANVLGVAGVRWMLDAARGAPADILVMASSCVPASPLETSGARLETAEIEELLGLEGVIGLAEVMNFPGVIAGDSGLAAKVAAAGQRPVDGHAPGVSGRDLAAYVAAGPGSDHEATTLEEAREKLRAGMRVMIREGTPARDLEALLPLITPESSRRLMFVNDDVPVTDLLERGHLDHHLRMAVAAGVDPVTAIQMVTLNPAEWFGLADRGALAPGRRADIAVLADLERFDALRTYHGGKLVAADGESLHPPRIPGLPPPSVHVDWDRVDLRVAAGPGSRARVIEVVPGAIVTGAGEAEAPIADGALAADPERDLALLATIERHTGASGSAVALVRGFGLRDGAIGSSVAHDHHNLIVAGTSLAEVEHAGRALAELGGGLVAVRGGEVLAALSLPVAGLMSPLDASEVERAAPCRARRGAFTGHPARRPVHVFIVPRPRGDPGAEAHRQGTGRRRALRDRRPDHRMKTATRILLLTAIGAALLAAPAQAKRSSLYDAADPRPGPDLLYSKAPKPAPQLQNKGPWVAKPILVSGAAAYRKGEFLYQDFLYDDHGARGSGRDANDPRADDTFSAPNGTYTYPRDPVYMDNAADLVELRVKPLAKETAFRITLNALEDPEKVAATIAIGDSPEPVEVPHGANASMRAEYFLTVHGGEAEIVPTAGGTAEPVSVKVSTKRNQFDLRVPHSAWDPGTEKVRLSAGVGLWDAANDSYLIPAGDSSPTTPGGAGGIANPPAFFNLAFRGSEPLPTVTGALTDPGWWRDKGQAGALSSGDLAPFHATVDFGKLERGVSDQMRDEPGGTPTTGPLNRILNSRFDTGEGAEFGRPCGEPDDCLGELSGRLQPYSVYVPEKPQPNKGYGLTLLLHSLAANYNQFTGTKNQSQIGERGRGSIVITPAGRGPDGWYWGHAGADTFEVWAEVARLYRLDSDWTSISGYSMGGYGTYKFAAQYPDLFARANPVVGPPGLGIWVPPGDPAPGGAASNTNRMLASVRNIPFLIWNGAADELVPVASAAAQAQTFDDLGYRYAFDLFSADHFLLAINDEYAPAAEFLGTHEVDRNPHHVSYVLNPAMDFANVKTVADHAYWLSGMRLRDASGEAPIGEVDAVSRGFGLDDPEPGATTSGGGSLNGGLAPVPFTERAKEWGEPVEAKAADRLELNVTNLSKLTVSPKRAKLSCDAELAVTTDGPLTVKLAGCKRTERFG